MSNQIKTEKVTVRCPLSLKTEIVFINCLIIDNKLIDMKPLGCETNYHSCRECDSCVEACRKKIIASFSAE